MLPSLRLRNAAAAQLSNPLHRPFHPIIPLSSGAGIRTLAGGISQVGDVARLSLLGFENRSDFSAPPSPSESPRVPPNQPSSWRRIWRRAGHPYRSRSFVRLTDGEAHRNRPLLAHHGERWLAILRVIIKAAKRELGLLAQAVRKVGSLIGLEMREGSRSLLSCGRGERMPRHAIRSTNDESRENDAALPCRS